MLRKFRLDIGYGLSWPAFCGQSNPGRYRRVFPSFGCFFSVFFGSIHQKKCYRGQVFTAKVFKGIIKWYCHRVPYITCHEGIKDENNSKAVVHDVC